MPRSDGGARGGPERMGHFGPGDIVMRSRKAATFANVSGALEIVERAGFKLVGHVCRLHFEIDDFYSRAPCAPRADSAVLGQLARRERDVTPRPGAERIEFAHGRITGRNRGDDRTA